MATTPSPSPAVPDEKSASSFPQTSTRAIEEVSEALNGLRELAARVTPQTQGQKPLMQTESAVEPQAEAQPEVESAEVEAKASVEETPAPSPAPVKNAAPVKHPRVGETLRDARERSGFSLDEVAHEVKIKPGYLHAIEEGRYNDLPSRTYAVGWVRAYAQAMGLHTDELVARCRAEVGSMPRAAQPLVMREPARDRRLPGGALMTVCVVLAVAVYAVSYSFLRPAAPAETMPAPAPEIQSVAPPVAPAPVVAAAPQPAQQSPIPQAAAPAPKVEAPATVAAAPPTARKQAAPVADAEEEVAEEDLNERDLPAPMRAVKAPEKVIEKKVAAIAPPSSFGAEAVETETPAAALPKPAPAKVNAPSRIKLRAVSDTSVRITDNEGRVLAERLIRRGEAFYVPDKQHYTLATTNAGALKLSVDGRDMPALGEAGEAMHNIPLDADNLKQVLAQ